MIQTYITSQDVKLQMQASLKGTLNDSQDALEDVLRIAKDKSHKWTEEDRMVVRSYLKHIKTNLLLIEAGTNSK